MRQFLAAVSIGLLGAFPAAAQEEARIQLLSFLAPIESAEDPTLRETSITIFLLVPDASLISAICELSPRLRDAVMETLSLTPIPVTKDRQLDVEAVQPLLLAATNKALRQEVVTAVEVIAGSKKFATGSSRSRASSLGCSVTR